MAGNVLKKETTEASRQTILCSPPNSIDYSSRAGASFFHLQKRGAEHLADGRGNKVPARSRTLGEEKITRREFRMMDDVLGKGRGKRIRSANDVVMARKGRNRPEEKKTAREKVN